MATPAVMPGATVVGRDVLRLSGIDTISFLQGQLSQDIEALAVGESAWSLLLQPQGKIDAWLRVSRSSDTDVVIDVDEGWGDEVVARLERFKLRVDVQIERLDWTMIALRGAGSAAQPVPEATIAADAGWPGVEGVDLLGPEVRSPADIAERTVADYESLRIEAGIPAMGSELDGGTIPAEAGIVERSASFTKGCYTGQELVARIDSRGSNTPRHLRRLVIEGDEDIETGAEVAQAGQTVGTVTSAAWSTRLDATVALAYLKRAAEVPGRAEVDGRAAEVMAP